jgi:hypothetical protein
MIIQFNTKDESNIQQEKDFLALSPAERVFQFFLLSIQLNQLPTTQKSELNKKNFILEKKKNGI